MLLRGFEQSFHNYVNLLPNFTLLSGNMFPEKQKTYFNLVAKRNKNILGIYNIFWKHIIVILINFCIDIFTRMIIIPCSLVYRQIYHSLLNYKMCWFFYYPLTFIENVQKNMCQYNIIKVPTSSVNSPYNHNIPLHVTCFCLILYTHHDIDAMKRSNNYERPEKIDMIILCNNTLSLYILY